MQVESGTEPGIIRRSREYPVVTYRFDTVAEMKTAAVTATGYAFIGGAGKSEVNDLGRAKCQLSGYLNNRNQIAKIDQELGDEVAYTLSERSDDSGLSAFGKAVRWATESLTDPTTCAGYYTNYMMVKNGDYRIGNGSTTSSYLRKPIYEGITVAETRGLFLFSGEVARSWMPQIEVVRAELAV